MLTHRAQNAFSCLHPLGKDFQSVVARFLSNNLIFILLVILGMTFFSLTGVSPSADSSWYLSNGLNIYNGYGYVDTDWSSFVINRGPCFPALIAVSFWLFGPSVEHAFWVVRVFYILNILITYSLGKRFYGKWAGLTAALMVITSFTINKWSSFLLLDNILPFFLMLAVLLVFVAHERGAYRWFVLGGVTLGVAFLTKEMGILFVSLPFLALIFIKDFRTKRNLIGSFLCISAFFIVVTPWAVHVRQVSGDLSPILGRASQKVVQTISPFNAKSNSSLSEVLANYFEWLQSYYENYIRKNFVLAPLFIAGWLFTFLRGLIWRNKYDLTIIFSFFLFLPIVLFQGRQGWRDGQNLMFYFLSFLVMGNLVITTGSFVAERILGWARIRIMPHTHCITTIIITLFVTTTIAIQIFGDKKMLVLWQGNSVKSTPGMSYYSGGRFKLGGWHNTAVIEAGKWVGGHVPEGSILMCDWYWLRAIYFHAQGDYKIVRAPYLTFAHPFYKEHSYGGERIYPSTPIEKPKFMWVVKKPRGNSFLRVFREGDFLREISEKRVSYFIVTLRRNFLSLYMNENSGFEEVANFGKGSIKIFKVNNPKLAESANIRIGSKVPDFLKRFEKKYPAAFESITENILKEKFTFTDDEIDKIRGGAYETFNRYRIY